jgi:dTDP-4-dehydrorhamnose reductase
MSVGPEKLRLLEEPQGLAAGRVSARFGRVAACVLTYNRKDTLLRCIDAVLAQTHSVNLLIVFDNGSTDGTREALETAGHFTLSQLHYVRVERNLGPAGGFSASMRRGYESGCEWVWVMDDDVLPAPTALEELAVAFQACFSVPESIGFLVSRVETPDGRPNNVPDVDTRQDYKTQPQWAMLLQHGLVRIAWATFNSTLFPRSTLRDFGFPKPDFFYGGDDVDLTLRIAKERPGYIVGKSLAVHLREVTGSFHPLNEPDATRIPLYFYYYRSQIYLRRAHMSRKALALFLLKIGRDVVSVLLNGQHRFRMIRTILAGTAAGFFFYPRPAEASNRSD